MKEIRNKTYHLLRWGERFTKTDNVYLAKGGFWLTGGQVVTSAASFVLALLFARLIPKEVYGNYKYILSLAGLFATFSLTGLSAAVVQSVARGFRGTFFAVTKILIKWNSLILLTSLSGSIYYLLNDNQTLGYGLLIVAVLFPSIRIFEVYESYLNGSKNFKKSAIYRGIVDIATIVSVAITLFLTDHVIVLLTTNLLTQFLLNALFYKKTYDSIQADQRTNIEPGIIEFGKHLSFQNVMSNVAAHIDKIIIFHYLGAVEVAIYMFATAIPQQIKGLISNAAILITPKISGRTAREAVSMIRTRFFMSLSILVPIVVTYIIFAPFIFKIFFPAYIEAVPYTQWYSLILLLMGNLSGLVLITQKASKEQYQLTVFGSVSQIILMFALVHNFGISGIIWGILISKSLTAILSYVLAKRLVKNIV